MGGKKYATIPKAREAWGYGRLEETAIPKAGAERGYGRLGRSRHTQGERRVRVWEAREMPPYPRRAQGEGMGGKKKPSYPRRARVEHSI